jgi:hypothetical protein
MSTSRVVRRFSLKSLLETPFKEIVDEIAIRATVQKEFLTKYPESRSISIMKSLYSDTHSGLTELLSSSKTVNIVSEGIQARILEKKLRALETRHSMIDTVCSLPINATFPLLFSFLTAV